MGLIKTLRETAPFNELPEEIFEEFNHAAKLVKFAPHTHIFNQHDQPSGFLYVIKTGLVEIVVLTPGGVEMIVDYRKEGSFSAAHRSLRMKVIQRVPAQSMKQSVF